MVQSVALDLDGFLTFGASEVQVHHHGFDFVRVDVF
jgi:hypothetical protein